jgi:nucleoside-diphosphate-sugar epimerase
MKVIVLGGTGNISTAIVARLLTEGHEVTCFNRGLRPVRYDGDVAVINGDKKDYSAFEAAMKPYKFDALIDMLSYNPADAAATLRAFEGRCGQFVFTSSSAVYRQPTGRVPITEDCPIRTENDFDYGFQKAEMERFLYGKMEEGIPITIIRPSLTTGIGGFNLGVTRGNYGIVKRIREGKPLVVFGDGTNPWSWTFSPDLAKAYVGVLGNPKTIGQFYHACTEEVHIWDELYQTFGKIIGVEPKIIHVSTELLCAIDRPTFEHIITEKMYPGAFDNSKIKAAVPEFVCDYTLEKGLRMMCDWYESDPAARVVKPEFEAIEDKVAALYDRWLVEAKA